MATKSKRKPSCTILVWSDDRLVVRYSTRDEAVDGDSDVVWQIRDRLHGRRAHDDPRWQIVDGRLVVVFENCTATMVP